MRHKSIETTMKYYVSQDADCVADELWAEHEADQLRGRPGTRGREGAT